MLFVVLLVMWRRKGIRCRPGLLTGTFLAGYGLARGFAEQFRELDPGVAFFAGGTTWAQWLSALMVAAGVILIARGLRRPAREPA